MSARQERQRLTASQEILRFIRNPRWCWEDATDDVKRGYLMLISACGIACGLATVFYSDWLGGRVACAAQFYRDERIYFYGLIGYVVMTVSSLVLLGVYIVRIQKNGLHSTSPPMLQGHWVWLWWTVIICSCLAAFVIVHNLLRMC